MRRIGFVLGCALSVGLVVLSETAGQSNQIRATTKAFVGQNRALGDFIQKKLPESGGFTYQTPYGQVCTTWTEDSQAVFTEYQHRLQELRYLTEDIIWYGWPEDIDLADFTYLAALQEEIREQITGIKILLQGTNNPVGRHFCIFLPRPGTLA